GLGGAVTCLFCLDQRERVGGGEELGFGAFEALREVVELLLIRVDGAPFLVDRVGLERRGQAKPFEKRRSLRRELLGCRLELRDRRLFRLELPACRRFLLSGLAESLVRGFVSCLQRPELPL
ncbi:MAG TPA: hypothetical protein DFS52_24705, partial [Myxococcales bacterium]|nr:hypothetical protein [Myxococcales bacterium]